MKVSPNIIPGIIALLVGGYMYYQTANQNTDAKYPAYLSNWLLGIGVVEIILSLLDII